MSHASGAAMFIDGVILYFEWDGTADVAIPMLWRTQEELRENWRSAEWRTCSCEPVAVLEPCRLMNTYANGESWPGYACRKCMVIVGGLTRDDESTADGYVRGYRDGEPAWSPWKRVITGG